MLSSPSTLALLGLGTMGAGIAEVAARAGFAVRVADASPEAVSRGMARIAASLDKAVEKGKVSPEERGLALGRIQPCSSASDAVSPADLIIEAVPEQMELKKALLQTVAASCLPHAIVASNTSSFSISRLGGFFGDPSRFLGMHFFNPVPVMTLLEVVRGDETREEVVEAVKEVGVRLGKTCIVVRDAPGFATSRLGITLGNEAMRMVEQGVASAKDIDTAMELGYRHPIGPLKLTDLVGLDVRLAITTYLHEQLGTDTFKPPEILKNMVAEGRLGKKTGKGFYEY